MNERAHRPSPALGECRWRHTETHTLAGPREHWERSLDRKWKGHRDHKYNRKPISSFTLLVESLCHIQVRKVPGAWGRCRAPAHTTGGLARLEPSSGEGRISGAGWLAGEGQPQAGSSYPAPSAPLCVLRVPLGQE